MRGIFFNQGEVCCAGSRLLVEEKVQDTFLAKLKTAAEKLIVGDPLNPSTDMGAQVSSEQYRKILQFIEIGRKEGATVVTGGGPASEKGYFIKPTVFSGVREDATISQQEIFGPVVAAASFRDIDDLARRANNTNYGLSAGIWTRDIGKAHRLAKAIRAGTVWVNCYNCFDAASPFGGYKDSGFGRELGKHAVELYTQVKSVWVALS
jgi:acyl-CoA reductase-like NAD-dependent aldehyde dehydrogenase